MSIVNSILTFWMNTFQKMNDPLGDYFNSSSDSFFNQINTSDTIIESKSKRSNLDIDSLKIIIDNETFVSNLTNLNFDNDSATFDISCSDTFSNQCKIINSSYYDNVTDFVNHEKPEKVYWALFLILLPFMAVFGNTLVILSVLKEKSLHSATNYFIASLAVADLLVAAIVMPFGIYYLVNVYWELSELVCDFYIAVDVTCSTASILNLVAISIDRFIAVTKPIKYAKHKINTRISITIATVWIASAAIAFPIVLGLNTSPERRPDYCIFYNSDFIIYSSLGSFYIPCVLMVFLYYKIFSAIHNRTKRTIGTKRSHDLDSNRYQRSDDSQSSRVPKKSCNQKECSQTIFANIFRSKSKESSTNSNKKNKSVITRQSSSIDNKDSFRFEDVKSEQMIKIIPPDKVSDNFQLEAKRPDCNTDSGYCSTQIEETQLCKQNMITDAAVDNQIGQVTRTKQNSIFYQRSNDGSFKLNKSSSEARSENPNNFNGNSNSPEEYDTVNLETNQESVDRINKMKKRSRFNLGQRHKSSRKKREKASVKRERKATKTLAIVLGVFLICWLPFFTCNIMDAICIKLQSDDCKFGMKAFLLTTWLGYMNSCVNPVIYTIFNTEFRKAFKKILAQSFSIKC